MKSVARAGSGRASRLQPASRATGKKDILAGFSDSHVLSYLQKRGKEKRRPYPSFSSSPQTTWSTPVQEGENLRNNPTLRPYPRGRPWRTGPDRSIRDLLQRVMEEEVTRLLPELYLHGLSQGDFELALRGLLGDGAPLAPRIFGAPLVVDDASVAENQTTPPAFSLDRALHHLSRYSPSPAAVSPPGSTAEPARLAQK